MLVFLTSPSTCSDNIPSESARSSCAPPRARPQPHGEHRDILNIIVYISNGAGLGARKIPCTLRITSVIWVVAVMRSGDKLVRRSFIPSALWSVEVSASVGFTVAHEQLCIASAIWQRLRDLQRCYLLHVGLSSLSSFRGIRARCVGERVQVLPRRPASRSLYFVGRAPG